MNALFRKPKAAAPLSPERQALAEAIQAAADAREVIRRAEETQSEATEKVWAAQEVVERAGDDRARAAERDAAFIRDKIAGRATVPPGLRRRGPSIEERVAKANREIEAWQRVRDAVPAVIQEQREELSRAESCIERAVTAVIASEAASAVEPLVARLEALNAEAGPIRAALHELLWKGRLNGEVEQRIKGAMGLLGRALPWALADSTPPGFERQPATLLMNAAFAALKQDATTPIPTLDQIEGLGNAS